MLDCKQLVRDYICRNYDVMNIEVTECAYLPNALFVHDYSNNNCVITAFFWELESQQVKSMAEAELFYIPSKQEVQ